MCDPLFVRRVERIADLRCVLQRLFQRQRTLQRRPLNQLHQQIVGTYVVKLADVGVIQRSD